MSDEQGWQPARMRLSRACHSDGEFIAPRFKDGEIVPEVVRVRPVSFDASGFYVCDSPRFSRIHPEDVKRYLGCYEERIICEHEILTD